MEDIVILTMVSRESEDEVFLPDKEDCLGNLRDHRWPNEVKCPHCESVDTIKKGTTRKGAQRYRCHTCNSIFNDLIGTIFAGSTYPPGDVSHHPGDGREANSTDHSPT